MNFSIYRNEKYIPSETFVNNDIKKIKNEYDESSDTVESSTVINEEKLRATKGIINALLFCIPFWFFFIKSIIWLVQK
jgi:hypothetical protein